MKVEIIREWRPLEAIFPRWDELARQDARDGFFRTPAWYRAWMQHIRPDAEPFVAVAVDDSGEIAGLAPFCRLQYRDLGWKLNSICWAGREVVSGDFLDFVADPDRKAAVSQAILAHVWNGRRDWSMLVAGELVEGGDTASVLESLSREKRLPMRVQEERMCPYIALPQTFDDYLGSLGSSTRYHVRRRIREVIEKNGARVETYSAGADIAERLDVLARLHRARWSKAGLPGTLDRPGFIPFLRAICEAPPPGAEPRLYFLSHGSGPIAAMLVFYFGESALYYQAGWDPASPLASRSPTVVLMAHSIRDAIEHGLKYFEFLRGDEGYKSHWTKTYRKTATLLVGGSMMSRQYLRMAHWKDKVKPLLRPRGAAAPEVPERAAEGEQADGGLPPVTARSRG